MEQTTRQHFQNRQAIFAHKVMRHQYLETVNGHGIVEHRMLKMMARAVYVQIEKIVVHSVLM